MTGDWETKTVYITGIQVDEHSKLDEAIAVYAVDGWEPWTWSHGGSTWIISFKRKRPIDAPADPT